MTTATIAPADTIAYHRERSWRFLNLVDDEVERGELEEAGNKLWGAGAHAIKAVAEARGWPHHAHALLEETVKRLIDEEGAPPHLYGQYMIASGFHQRFYGAPSDPKAVGYGKVLIAEFSHALESRA